MENNKKVIRVIFWVVFAGIMYWYYYGGGLEKQVADEMQKIEKQVALDAEKQYEIAKNQGDKMQIYVQASLVSAAYLQAKDEYNYQKWKSIEESAAREAGMSR